VGHLYDFHTRAAVDPGGVLEQVSAAGDVLGDGQVHGAGGLPVGEAEGPEGGLHEQVHHVVDEAIGGPTEDELEEGEEDEVGVVVPGGKGGREGREGGMGEFGFDG